MDISPLTPTQNKRLFAALDSLDSAGLGYVLIVADKRGGDVVANLDEAGVRALAAKVAAAHGIEAKPH